MNVSLDALLQGILNVTPGALLMIAVGCVPFYLGIAKEYEPMLLLPIGAGAIFANLPLSPMVADGGMLDVLKQAGVDNELFPQLISIGIGAMTDFGPLLENPRMMLIGAAGQFGIFGTLSLALVLGFSLNEAASIGLIGAIDGPTSIYVSNLLASHLLGPITVCAYSYMSLVPMATPLIGSLMLGNLLKESGVVERLTGASSKEIASTVTLFLGLAVGATMRADAFLQVQTLGILVLGIIAFCLDIAAGLTFAKILNFLSGGKFNPLIGSASISAFPMSARVVQKVGQEEDFENFLLMHAMGANASGQVASVIAGGVLLALMGAH